MQYLLLIYTNEETFRNQLSGPDLDSMMDEYRALTQSIAQSGHYKGGNRLQPTAAATTVRVRNGKRQTTDGPFAETREQLGGYYLIEAADLDEAIAIAERIPASRIGSVEVRPIAPTPAAVPA